MISDTFAKQIRSYTILTRKEERELAIQMRQGDTKAREKLINCNLRFVLRQAYKRKSYCDKGRVITFNGLVQEGITGLCRAVDKFDPDQTNKLISYAVWWIDAAMNRYIMDNFAQIKLCTTTSARILFFKSRDITKLLGITDQDEREQERIRISEAHNVSLKDVKAFELRVRKSQVSIDEPSAYYSDGTPISMHECLPSPNKQIVEESDLRVKIMEAFHQVELNPKEFVVISKRFLEDDRATLQSIGDELGISRERVRQIQVTALTKLRRHFRAEGYSLEKMGLAA